MNAITIPPRNRGRPPNLPRETPAQSIERLRRELSQAEAVQAAEAEKQAAIVGRCIIGHMARDAAFRGQIAALLRDTVKRKDDLAAVAALLLEA